jgi:hypothetical protein
LIVEVAGYRLETDYNDLPDVRVWGDGRIVWVVFDAQGHRHVLEGHLTQTEMTTLIQSFITTGFFSRFPVDTWNDTAGIATTVSVTLTDRHRSVTKGTRTMTSPQHDLIAQLRVGAGAQGAPFTPTSGRILTYTCEERKMVPCQTAQHWPTAHFGDTLALTHTREQAIVGEPLQLAWRIVNDSREPLVESNGQIYWIGISIPTISS